MRIVGVLKLILLPVLFSILITANYKTPNEGNINVVVVQPNIDPYNEKFSGLTPQEQLQKMLALAEEKIDSNTDYLVGPETSLVNEMIEGELEESPAIVDIRAFLKKHPQLTFVTGASTIKEYKPGEKISPDQSPFERQAASQRKTGSAQWLKRTLEVPCHST